MIKNELLYVRLMMRVMYALRVIRVEGENKEGLSLSCTMADFI